MANSNLGRVFYHLRGLATKTPEVVVFTHPNLISRSDLLETARMKVNIKQQAQLSQRDRAMLRDIEYFDKSLKVIRNDTFEKGVSLLVFRYNYVSRTVFEIFSII